MKSLFLVLCFILFVDNSQAEEANVKKLPSLLGGSNAGNEFYLSFPPAFEEVTGGDNSLRIFVASGVRQEVTVEVKGKGVKLTKFTVPNDVIEFRISPSDGFPYVKPVTSTAPPEKVYQQAAIYVKSRSPIVVYGVVRFQYTYEGFLAIPVSAFGTEYVIAAYPQYKAAGSSYDLPSVSNIIAAYDDTEVTFTMGGTNGSRTTGGLGKGQKATVTMNKGDVWCFADAGATQDISGSLVKATKPIGIVSGNQCANVPAGVVWCDVINEMELPTFTWGKEYHVAPIIGRQKAPLIRIFAKETNTKVFRDGIYWFTLSLNDRGEEQAFSERRTFSGDLISLINGGKTPCKIISSDKPIYVMLYNPGQTDDNVVSDPFQMVLTPLEQYQNEIIFATPYAKGSSLPPTKYFVNLVYQTNPDGSIPDDLEFATVVNGKFTWKKVNIQFGSDPGYRFSTPDTVAIPISGKNYAMKCLQLNDVGLFRIRSSVPLAAYSYGYAPNASYGFPTSLALKDLENKDTVKPIPEWKQLCNGSVVGIDSIGKATITDKPDDTVKCSKLGLIYMDLDSSYNYEFDYDVNREFIAGTTIKTDWSLKVIDPATDARGMLVFVDRAGNDTIIDIMYKAFAVDIEAKDTDFGKCKPGETITKSIDLVNKNKNSSATVKNLTLKSGSQGFTILNATFPLTIPAGGKVTLQVSFKSDAKGEFRDAFLMDDGCVIAEKGTVKAVVGEPVIYVSEIDFGTIKKGTNVTLPLIVRNEGDAELTITGYTLPKDPNVFRLKNWPSISAQTPLVLQPAESRQLEVEFTAVDAVSYTDAIVFSSDARTRDSIVELKGKGIQGGLLARGADWGRKRTGNGPYIDAKGITLENIGNGPIRIIQSSAPNAEFAFDKNIFNGVTLQPGEVKEFEAAFSPTVIGNDKLIVTFETDMGTTVPTNPPLRGAGIIGTLATRDYDFDSTIVQGVVRQNNKKVVVFTNIGTTDAIGADFSDGVEIKDLLVVSTGSINETNASYGTQGFKYDKAALNLPRILKKGESMEIKFAEFQAQKPGAAMAEIQTESDASNTVISKWTGWGVDPFRPDPKIELTGGRIDNICIGSIGEIITTVKNVGNIKFPVLNAFISPENSEFLIDAASMSELLANNLDLNETRNVKIKFSPQGTTGARTVLLGLVGPTVDDTVYVDITGTGVSYTMDLEVVGESDIVNGSKTSAVIRLKTAPSAIAGVKSLPLTIKYDPKVFNPEINDIELIGSYAFGYKVIARSMVRPGEISLIIQAESGLIDKSGDILNLPMYVATSMDLPVASELSIIGESSGCLMINPWVGSFTINDKSHKGDLSPLLFINRGTEFDIIVYDPLNNIDKTLEFFNVKGQLIKKDILQPTIDSKTVCTYQTNVFTPGAYTVKYKNSEMTYSKLIIISE